MELTSKIALEQYFEQGDDLQDCFLILRNEQIIEPVVEGVFRMEEANTIKIADSFKIYEGDVLIYPKTRQYCYIDDIRHMSAEGYFIVHYHTKYQRIAHSTETMSSPLE